MLRPEIYARMGVWVSVIVLIFTYIGGLFLPIMPIDAAQYASISREMLATGNYWSVMHHSADYLDKPPLLFWLSALSFAVFGINSFAYRLPSVGAACLGVYATYRLARLHYDRPTALLAAALLASTQAYFLFCHDIRTDTLLASFVIVAIWLFAEWDRSDGRRWAIAWGGFTAMGLAMLAKGPIGAAVPLLAMASTWAIRIAAGQGSWRAIRRFLCIGCLGLAWVGLLLSPMLYGLYEQYGTYGWRFYFWEQSFGRITGENRWHNQTDALFFVHTFLWAFLPYSLLALAALWGRFRAYGQYVWQCCRATPKTNIPPDDALLLGGFVLPFIALSLSHYKLPHYIFVVFPLAAITTAAACRSGNLNARFWYIAQHCIGAILSIAALVLPIWVFPQTTIALKIAIAGGFVSYAFMWVITFQAKPYTTAPQLNVDANADTNANVDVNGSAVLPFWKRLSQHSDKLLRHSPPYLPITFAAIVLLNAALNSVFYPQLSRYESGYQAALRYQQYAKNPNVWQQKNTFHNIDKNNENLFVVQSYGICNHAFDFYTQQHRAPISQPDSLLHTLRSNSLAVYTDAAGLALIDSLQIAPLHTDTLPHIAVTRLKLPFLQPSARANQAEPRYLVWLARQGGE
ncbi:MAG: glycosyltransferase family 39 protein [Chitinophagales bacterium]|nr:glycosyltransferase family 39 protein [Chitinophagales bacterium]